MLFVVQDLFVNLDLYLQTQECDIVAGFGIAHMGGHFPENIANQLTGIIHGMFFQNIYQPVIARLLLVHILCLSHTVGLEQQHLVFHAFYAVADKFESGP